jgi:hypothetical protein
MKDEGRAESCDMLSWEHEVELQLDEPAENTCFTPLSIFFILHNTCENKTRNKMT